MSSAELSGSFEDRMIETTIVNLRKQPFRNPEVQAINEDWVRESFNVTAEQSSAIGMLWLTKILGVEKVEAEAFSSGDMDVYQKIGYLHAGSRTFKPDVKSFWEGVAKAAPQLAKDKLEFLIANDHEGEAAWTMICSIDGMNPRSDFLTTKLVANALLYK